MKVRKCNPDAVIPTKSLQTDAGFDLYAVENVVIYPGERRTIRTGICVEIPEGCVGLIWPPIFYNTVQQNLLQFPSTVPTGEIMVCLLNTSPRNGRSRSTDDQEVILTEGETFHKNAALINKKDRIAQLLIQEIRTTTLIEVDSLLDNPKQLDE